MPDFILDAMGSVLAFFYAGVASYGLAIIGLTVAVRLLLFPLTAKQARSMQRMQLVQPEIKRIQAQYKDDRQKLNEEIMKFYKENKINPVAGCLPLVAQMPIFFALFAVLRKPFAHVPPNSRLFDAFCGDQSIKACGDAGPKGLRFLGMDLGQKINADHGAFTDALPYFILVGFVVITGYLQFRQTQARQTGAANPQMNMIGKIFPVMFAFISLSLPAGVVLYFFVSNAWQIGQQALIYGSLLPGGVGSAPATTANGAKPDPVPPRPEVIEGESRTKGSAGKAPSSGGPDGFGRSQPAGSRPRPKRRRR